MPPTISQRSPAGKLAALKLCEQDPEISSSSVVAGIIVKARTSWLKNEEVLTLLQFFVEQSGSLVFPDVAAHQPEGGSLFVFSRKKCRSFRADKHAWRKKNDNKTIKETHEKLKVADKETLNCYYAHADSGDGLQRRCYWILDKLYDDVVMVHYLCAMTSRVAVGGRASVSGREHMPRVRSRPQRAASLKAKFASLSSSDSDELDGLQRGSGGGGRLVHGSRGGGQDGEGLQVTVNKPDDEVDELGDPLDSFMAKLPDDLGTFTSKDLLLEGLPGDLSITHEQLSKVLQTQRMPGKGPDVSLGLSGLLSATSIGKDDLLGLINDGALLHSPKAENKKGQGQGGQPSLQISDVADSLLLKGFSRLESMEILKMMAPDFQNMAPGLSDVGSDEPGPSGASGTMAEDKVSTIRRVVAPSTTSGLSHFQSLASASMSPSQERPAGFDSGNLRKTRVNPMTTKDHGKSKADVAKDKTDFNLERRESLLRKVRNKNDGLPLEFGMHNPDSGDLIEPSNVLFRSSSHLMEKANVSPEKARALLKTMSIDDRDDFLPRVLSAEMKSTGLGDAFGSTVLEEENITKESV